MSAAVSSSARTPAPWDLLRERIDRASILGPDQEIPGPQIVARAGRIAEALRARGVRPGHAVAVIVPQTAGLPLALLGAWAAGAVAMPLDARLPDREIRRLVSLAGAAFAIAGRDPGVAWAPLDALEAERRPPADPIGAPPRPPEEALLLVTSGTLGPSKLASVPARALRVVRDRFPLGPDQTFLAALPLAHAFGLFVGMLAPLARGARVVVCDWTTPADVVAFGTARRASVMPMVPRMLSQVLRAGLRNLGTIRAVVVGAAAASADDLIELQERFGVLVGYGYGMTETSAVTTLNLHVEEKRGSVGRPFPGVSIRIAGPDGSSLPPGVAGEVWLRDQALVSGYAGDDGLPVEGGWLRTGDVGYLDEEGYLFLTGRSKDVVITSGFNVAPAEVEAVLLAHPLVEDAAVYGRPHPELGEELVAVVVARDGLEPEELRAFARERLPGYKVPREIRLTGQDLPRTATGKVAKWRLEEVAI